MCYTKKNCNFICFYIIISNDIKNKLLAFIHQKIRLLKLIGGIQTSFFNRDIIFDVFVKSHF